MGNNYCSLNKSIKCMLVNIKDHLYISLKNNQRGRQMDCLSR